MSKDRGPEGDKNAFERVHLPRLIEREGPWAEYNYFLMLAHDLTFHLADSLKTERMRNDTPPEEWKTIEIGEGITAYVYRPSILLDNPFRRGERKRPLPRPLEHAEKYLALKEVLAYLVTANELLTCLNRPLGVCRGCGASIDPKRRWCPSSADPGDRSRCRDRVKLLREEVLKAKRTAKTITARKAVMKASRLPYPFTAPLLDSGVTMGFAPGDCWPRHKPKT